MNTSPIVKHPFRPLLALSFFALFTGAPSVPAQSFFTPGNLVISVEGNGVVGGSGSYTHNQAAPLTLFQYTPNGTSSATYVNSLVLPQTASGSNLPVSDEYGSTSESSLALTGNGQYLTIMGYGINAATFNSNYTAYSADGDSRLAQSGSLTGQSYTPVARVVAVINASGNVNSSTGLFNVFDQNNPRSVYSPDGTNFYVSGQGSQVTPDATGGVFYTTLGSSSVSAITAGDAGNGTSQDTRNVLVYNGQLYVSLDSKTGATSRSFVGTVGTGTPTSGSYAPTNLPGFGTTTGKLTLATGQTNGINSAGLQINLSPEGFFFANSTTLYVADTGAPHQTSATSPLGDGGLQKWSLVGGTWQLDYTLAQGLSLVQNAVANPSDTSGTTGLRTLTGEVVGNQVYLYATNYTIGDLNATYLYGISDTLSDTSGSQVTGESFSQLATAPSDSKFMGVSFAPTPEPNSAVLILGAGGWLAGTMRGRRNRQA